MPRPILHQREICSTLKCQRNKAGSHPVWRHYDPDSLRTLFDNALHLIGMEWPLLG
jgi:hypothetical protein